MGSIMEKRSYIYCVHNAVSEEELRGLLMKMIPGGEYDEMRTSSQFWLIPPGASDNPERKEGWMGIHEKLLPFIASGVRVKELKESSHTVGYVGLRSLGIQYDYNSDSDELFARIDEDLGDAYIHIFDVRQLPEEIYEQIPNFASYLKFSYVAKYNVTPDAENVEGRHLERVMAIINELRQKYAGFGVWFWATMTECQSKTITQHTCVEKLHVDGQ